VFEALGVQPVFLSREQAIDYATCRACFRSGEIHILKSNGAVERIIPFDGDGSNLVNGIGSFASRLPADG